MGGCEYNDFTDFAEFLENSLSKGAHVNSCQNRVSSREGYAQPDVRWLSGILIAMNKRFVEIKHHSFLV
jgi:hypothetical protein